MVDHEPKTTKSSIGRHQQRPPCRYQSKPGGCLKRDSCPFAHAEEYELPSARLKGGSMTIKSGRINSLAGTHKPPPNPQLTPTQLSDLLNALVQGTQDLIHSPLFTSRSGPLLYFGHDALDDATRGPSWRGFLHHYSPTSFSHQAQAKRFVTALVIGLPKADEFLTAFSKCPHAFDIAEALLTRPYACNVGEPKKAPLSFQRCLVPLIIFLSDSRVCGSILHEESALLLGLVNRHFASWSAQYVANLQELVQLGSVDDPDCDYQELLKQDPHTQFPLTFVQIFLPLLRVLYELGSRFRNLAYSDEFFNIAQIIQKEFTKVQAKMMAGNLTNLVTDTPYSLEVVAKEVSRVVAMVNMRRKQLDLSQMVALEAQVDRKRAELSQNNPWSVSKSAPLKPAGKPPAHDNDFFDIASISILPTMGEITAPQDRGSLPGNYQDYPYAHWLPSGPQRLLDTHFRLLREDLVSPVRSSVNAFLCYVSDQTAGKGGKGISLKNGRLRGNLKNDGSAAHTSAQEQVDLNVYENAQILDFEVNKRSGLCAKVKFTLPASLLSEEKKKDAFKAYWERTQKLSMNALVSLLWKRKNDTAANAFDIIFGTITGASPLPLGITEGVIFITFPDLSLLECLLKGLSANKASDGGPIPITPNYIVEPNLIMFEAYRPVLRALQKIDPLLFPFTDYLCPSAESQAMHAKDFIPVKTPNYTRSPDFYFDLSVLCPKGGDLSFDPNNDASRESAITSLQASSSLDHGQCSALVNSLSREFALIQGPPGTGKSYVGIQLVRALLANKRRMKLRDDPILIICYTNHALDQFLTHVLDSGINSVARMGGRSSSDRIQDLSIDTLVKTQNSVIPWDHRQLIRSGMKLLEDSNEGLEKLVQQLVRNNIYWDQVGPYLEATSYEQYRSLLLVHQSMVENLFDEVEEEEASSWTKSKKKGKRTPPPDVIGLWISCEDLEELKNCLKTKRKHDTKNQKSGNRFKGLEDVDETMETEIPLDVMNSAFESFNLESPHSYYRWSATELEALLQSNRPLEQLLEVSDVWCLSQCERHRLLNHWKTEVPRNFVSEFIELGTEVNKAVESIQKVYNQQRVEVLKSKDIVGVTTTACAKYHDIIKALAPSIVICEEAGEVLESHILSSIHPDLKHLILIGDHEQLRPKIAVHSLGQESREGKKYRLDLSLFERLQTSADKIPLEQLSIQRRMHPCISNLIRRTIYPRLEDGESVKKYDPVRGISKNLFFLHHENREDSAGRSLRAHSHSNAYEVEMILALLRYLLRQGYVPSDLVILTPYVGQLLAIRDKLRKEMMVFVDERDAKDIDKLLDAEEDGPVLSGTTSSLATEADVLVERKALGRCVRVSTIDNFQGEEAKIILISLVRNSSDQNSIGFLATSNRINVLLSRAQHGMYLVGNADLLASKSKMWNQVLTMLKEDDAVGEALPIYCMKHPETAQLVSHPGMFDLVAPDGGCTLPCPARLPKCGHKCRQLCHSDMQSHVGMFCLEDCRKLHEGCDHPCVKRCGDPCGLCMRNVGIATLPCGHEHPNTICYVAKNGVEKISCQIMVPKIIPQCGHEVRMPCFRDPKTVSCARRCDGYLLNCGHLCTKTCGECCKLTLDAEPNIQLPIQVRKHHPCAKTCDKPLVCKHSCQNKCHGESKCSPCHQLCSIRACTHSSCQHNCSDLCQACLEPCIWECDHQGKCPLVCGAPCVRLPCDKRCDKVLSCGHQCPSVCGEACPTTKFCRECDDALHSEKVDLIMFMDYKDIELDEDPVIVLRCGHIFTVSTLDGVIELSKFYTQNADGSYALAPLPEEFIELPVCPTCRCPIRNVNRYGRVCNRAMTNLSEKLYIMDASMQLNKLSSSAQSIFVQVEGDKANCDAFIRTFSRTEQGSKNPTGPSQPPSELTNEQDKLWKVWLNPLATFGHSIKTFIKFVKRSPQQAIYEACCSHLEAAGRLHDSVKVDMGLPKSYINFQRQGLKLWVEVQLNLFYQMKRVLPALDGSRPSKAIVVKSCQQYLRNALFIVKESLELSDGKVVDTSLCDARMLWLEVRVEKLVFERAGSTSGGSDEKLEQKITMECMELEEEWDKCKKTLLVSFIYANQDRIASFERKLQQLRGPFYQSVSDEEKRMVFQVMQSQFHGSGHWYQCVNGHVYTIGECGGAMAASTCPDCGAVIGGTNHQLAPDNQRSREFEAMARRL